MKSNAISKTCRSRNFDFYAKHWLELAAITELKQSSFTKYRNIIKLYLSPYFGKKKIPQIARSEINDFSSLLLTRGGALNQGLKPSTVNATLTVLKKILDFAAQELGCQTVNLRNIRLTIHKPSAPVLRSSEQNRLWNFLHDNLSPCNLGILLCLKYGLRIGEICALRWGDIDLRHGTLSICRSLSRKQTINNKKGKKTEVVIAPLKSSSSERIIPLTFDDIKFLSRHERSSGSYILTGTADRYIEPRTLENRFKKVLQACKINQIKFHSLRHSFATRWIELGNDVKILSEILGHSSVNVTLNFYVHPSFESKRRSIMNFSKKTFKRNK